MIGAPRAWGTMSSPPMSFLDPYSSNRRVPLIWIGRAVLLALLVGLWFLGRWLWGLAG